MSLLIDHIRDLRRVRRFISLYVAKTIAIYLVGSLYITTNKDFATFQRVQMFLAKVSRVYLIFFAQCRI